MPAEILAKFKTAVEPAFTFTSIANGAGRICALIDNTTTRAPRGIVAVSVETGTSPTNNSLFKLYLIRQTNASTNKKGGGGSLGDSDAGVSSEPSNAEIVGSIVVSSTSNTAYQELFRVENPGPKFSFVLWNATGATSRSTQPSVGIQWLPIVDEAQ